MAQVRLRGTAVGFWTAGVIGVLGIASGAAAYADDAKAPKIDCSDTDLGFTAPGYDVSCTDLSDGTLNVGDSFAGAKAAKLVADSNGEATFLVVIDNRPLGGRIYIKRRSLQNDVEGYFNGGTFHDWGAGTTVAQFEVENFTGETEGGQLMDCIGFRHQGVRRYDGLARLVVGIACSGLGREHTYDALKHLQAPSG
jgi:hypothetical protein